MSVLATESNTLNTLLDIADRRERSKGSKVTVTALRIEEEELCDDRSVWIMAHATLSSAAHSFSPDSTCTWSAVDDLSRSSKRVAVSSLAFLVPPSPLSCADNTTARLKSNIPVSLSGGAL
jgi:hypothetical protein